MIRAGLIDDERGQMTVELCIVFPVIIVIAAIAINALCFFSECAEFDRVARNCVRIYATSLPESADSGSVSASITSKICEEMETESVECQLSGDVKGSGNLTCTLTYKYSPNLLGMPLRGSIFGVSLPDIPHSIKMTVDPYSPGKWLWSFMK